MDKLTVEEYEFLLDVLSEKQITLTSIKELGYIVELRKKIRALMYKRADEE